MVRNDLFIKVPSFFKCPISLEVMNSPVSLCTGVTYDRSSIQKWLDSGNNTCPATMQVLQSKDIIPNHTLQRLIKIWSESVKNQSDSDHPTLTTTPPPLSSDQARAVLDDIENGISLSSDLIAKLGRFAHESERNKEFLINAGCVPVLAGVLRGETRREVGVYEEAMKILLALIVISNDPKALIDASILDSFSLVFQKGSLDGKIDCARLIEIIAGKSKHQISEKEDLLDMLLKFACSETNPRALDAGLSCLIALAAARRVRSQMVRLRAVSLIGKLLLRPDSCGREEKMLKLLEMMSACPDGRSALCEDPVCIPAIVQKMLKVSNAAMEHAVVILWSVCHVFRDQRAQEAVVRSNGLTKMLLLMQSNCSPAVRQMASDLLKISRFHGVCSKNSISSYNSKTTHIMPF